MFFILWNLDPKCSFREGARVPILLKCILLHSYIHYILLKCIQQKTRSLKANTVTVMELPFCRNLEEENTSHLQFKIYSSWSSPQTSWRILPSNEELNPNQPNISSWIRCSKLFSNCHKRKPCRVIIFPLPCVY